MSTEENQSQAANGTEEERYPSEGYAWFVVGILMIVYIFSFVDRQILGFLVGPIKEDLGISDTQISYLMGFSFALFYTVFGIPLGRLADSKSRRGIIAIGLAVWSFFTAGCGLARNYTMLLVMRMGVGVGEASLSPSAYSLISDLFRPQKMGLAISVYGGGIYVGSGIAYLLGGLVRRFTEDVEIVSVPLVGDVAPWQSVFFMIGIPGLLFTLSLLAIKEPARRGLGKANVSADGAVATNVPFAEVVAYIWKNRWTFLCHTVGAALLSFTGYGASAWMAEFFIRIHEWEPGAIGVRYGSAVMIMGSAGIIFGGRFAGYLANKGYKDSKIRVMLIACVVHLPLGLLYPLVPNPWVAYVILWPSIFTLAMPFGVAPAAIQEIMPNRMRGQASAVYLFIVNLIGLGIGPSSVAWCTDYLFHDDFKIHYSLAIASSVAGIVATVLLWSGMRHFKNSLDHLEDWHAENS